jgi:hypothetical protein
LLDAARLQKAGVPTVAVVWDTFTRAARSMASLQGLPDLPIVVIPKVGPAENEHHQRAKAAAAAPAVAAGWRDEHAPEAGSQEVPGQAGDLAVT